MISVVSRTDTQGCGEVLRVTWEVLEDYQKMKESALSCEEEKMMDRAGDKLTVLVTKLKDYMILMEEQGYENMEFRKFRTMLI
jgi:hypothetical protein